MGIGADNAHGPAIEKVFAPLFSKSGCFLRLAWRTTLPTSSHRLTKSATRTLSPYGDRLEH
jgi:hypothetical protein